MSRSDQGTFRSIQTMRALAAFMVVCVHVGTTTGMIVSPPEINATPHWLASGVDIFFVISGFVMVVATDGKAVTPPVFLKARLIRIIPLYWAALTVLLIWIAVIGNRPMPLPSEIVRAYAFIFYTDAYTGHTLPFLIPGWSLNYEMYFYVLFALTLWLRVPARIAVLGSFFVAMVSLRFLNPAGILRPLSSPIPLEFVAGMTLGALRHHAGRFPPLLGVVAIFVGLTALCFRPELPRTIAFGGPAILIVAGAIIAEPLFRSRLANPAVWLGDASYSLYLSHVFFIELIGLTGLYASPSIVICAAVTAVATAAALPVYLYVEKPLTKFARSLAGGRAREVRVQPGMPPS